MEILLLNNAVFLTLLLAWIMHIMDNVNIHYFKGNFMRQ